MKTTLSPMVRFRLRPEHLDLVRAALAPGDVAAAAYQRWSAAVPLDATDAGSYRLVPLLHHNLAGSAVLDDQTAARFAKMARFTWVKTKLITHRAEHARAALADAEIDSLAIKGLAVIHHSGLGPGLRPMDDGDIIVHVGDVIRALGVLGKAGFRSDEVDLTSPEQFAPLVTGHHGLNLCDGSGVQVDLHWHAIPHALHPDADMAMWRRARDGMPSREDTFVQVLAHACRWSWAPSVQWVADAVALAKRGLDWSVVLDEVRSVRLGVQIADALDVVTSTGLVEIDASIIRTLRRAPILQGIEARPRRTNDGTWRPSTRVERLADGFGDHVRRTVPPGKRTGLPVVGSFLCERWDVERMRELPRHAAWILSGRWPAAYRRRTTTDTGQQGSTQTRSGDVVKYLEFSVGGNGLALLGRGWSFPEHHGSWTIGTEAIVTLPVPGHRHDDRPRQIRFEVVPFLCTNIPRRRVDVYADGAKIDSWRFEGSSWSPQEIVVEIPTGSRVETNTARHAIEVRFVVHDPISPQAADHDVGTRQLGFALASSTIEEAPAPPTS